MKQQFGIGPTATTSAYGITFTPAGKVVPHRHRRDERQRRTDLVGGQLRRRRPADRAFTFAPAAPVVGEPVDLDGSGSADSDGTVASYDWDLDDDGEYDDATGAMTTTALSTARSFAQEGEAAPPGKEKKRALRGSPRSTGSADRASGNSAWMAASSPRW